MKKIERCLFLVVFRDDGVVGKNFLYKIIVKMWEGI